MRSSCPPRGPKKGYLRELQKQIGEFECEKGVPFLGAREGQGLYGKNFGLTFSGFAKLEHLQNRVKEQNQEDGTTTSQTADCAPQNQTTAEDEDASSEGANEAQLEAPVLVSTGLDSGFDNVQSWSAPVTSSLGTFDMAFSFPPMDLDSQNFRNLAPSAIDLHTVQPQATAYSKPGLENYLSPMICADLDQLYFDRVHVFAPILQKFRYLSWAREPGKAKQRTCLQYAMWTLAASLSSQFHLLRVDLYAEARQRLDALEMDNHDTQTVCIEQAQAWTLLAIFELTSNTCDYKRGMVSAGRAFRLVQLMRLNEIDGPGHTSTAWPSQLRGQSDWIDIESMRRTFWVVYTIDRFTSVLDNLPLTFNEQQVRKSKFLLSHSRVE